TRMLINEVGSHQEMLKNTSDTASLVLKEHTKVSIQQKWNTLLQKYHDIKDKIASTKEVVIQNNCEFFDNMNIYLRRNPSVTVPITSDSICGIKRKVQESTEDQDDDDNETKKRKSTHSENKSNIEKIQGLIKEQTEAITKIIRD
ncbi:24798_t:CDS:2, partial [Gigaspora rosea]